jgi:histidinol phosphatase-like enzyme (inositol monophosphatase family)
MVPDPKTFRQFAHTLADAARTVTLAHRPAGAEVADKNAGGLFDPVTEADRKAERVLRGLIEARFPDNGISGEEFPDRPGSDDLSWSLDPIDGTRSFICGLPTWTTLIALLQNGRPILGVIDAPRLGERYLGLGDDAVMTASDGTETRLKVSGCTRLAQARLATTDPFLFEGAEAEGFERVRRGSMTQRYGQDAYAYARLASGTIDLVIENQLKPHDYNALIPVIRGAGGVVTDWRGGEDFEGGRVAAAATRELLDEALALLKA